LFRVLSFWAMMAYRLSILREEWVNPTQYLTLGALRDVRYK
jgi:hypothetical protein